MAKISAHVVGGVVIAADQADVYSLQHWANVTGVTGSPFDSFLTLRGIRTLFTRVESQQRTRASVVALLTRHPAVRVVHYPGLPSHPGHAIAHAQQRGFGSMLSFELDGDASAVRHFIVVAHPGVAGSCSGILRPTQSAEQQALKRGWPLRCSRGNGMRHRFRRPTRIGTRWSPYGR
jgi:hypothetical protein